MEESTPEIQTSSKSTEDQSLNECFFINGLPADGKPFIYSMHKNTGISGGPGPTGSIKSKTVTITIPRSRRALVTHRTGFLIKLLFFLLAAGFLSPGLFTQMSFLNKFIVSSCIILAGGLATVIFYRVNRTGSRFFTAHKYPLVLEYKKKGYQRGFHPMMSTTPLEFIAWFIRLLF